MKKVAIITDSGSDISYEDEKRLGIEILPFKIAMGEESYVSRVDFDNEKFYQMLDAFDGLPTTSQITTFQFQDLYEEKDTFGSITLKPNIARYFNDGVKQMLIIYNTDAIESLVAEIEKMPEDTNIITYVFSTNNYPLNADFEDVADKVSLCALPAAINNAYRNVLPNKLTPKSDDHETETISGE